MSACKQCFLVPLAPQPSPFSLWYRDLDQSLQEDVWVVGRVCCEDENRLTEGTVMLEGSNAHSQVSLGTHLIITPLKKTESWQLGHC